MDILSGKNLRPEVALTIKEELKDCHISFYLYSDRDDFACQAYIKNIKKMLENFNVPYSEGFLNKSLAKEENLNTFINESKNKYVLLARPLNIDYEEDFLNALDPNYDPDMLTLTNRGKLFGGDLNYLPATARSVKTIIDKYNIEIKGKKCVIVGRSISVGLPCFQLINKYNGLPTILHSQITQKDRREYIKNADVIILATGKSDLINREDLNPNQTIIDCGYNPNGGDLGFVPNENELKAYTPVPFGVGSLTTYCLLLNACYLEKNNK